MKRLVLLGGGHAHVKVLADLAERPLAGWDVHIVSPYRRQIYSGMLPGWVAGHYPIESCAIALDSLAADARARFHQTAGMGIDAANNEIACADGTRLRFDLLSIDSGPLPALGQLPGSLEHALPIRPIEGFVAAWPGLVDRILGRCRRFDLVILGAGAAGVELAFAIQHRATVEGWSHLRVVLVGSGALPLEGGPACASRKVARLLSQRAVAWQGERRAVAIAPGQINFEQGPPALEPPDAGALSHQHREPVCDRLLGALGLERRLGLALEGPDRPRLHAPLRLGRSCKP